MGWSGELEGLIANDALRKSASVTYRVAWIVGAGGQKRNLPVIDRAQKMCSSTFSSKEVLRPSTPETHGGAGYFTGMLKVSPHSVFLVVVPPVFYKHRNNLYSRPSQPAHLDEDRNRPWRLMDG